MATRRAVGTSQKRPLKSSRNKAAVPLTDFPEPLASKQARLIAMLQSASGATIEQMKTLTGWQAHTLRGTISGSLRKRLGLNVICNPPAEDGSRVYRIMSTQSAA